MVRRSTIPFSLTAGEIAAMQLAGLPASKSQINRRAKTDGWRFDPRYDRGGGRLYLTDDLPLEAREDLRTRRKLFPDANSNMANSNMANSNMANSNMANSNMGRPKGSDYFTRHPEVGATVTKIMAEQRLAAPRIMELLRKDFGELPSMRSLQRFVARVELEKAAFLSKHRDPDAYKGNFRMSLGRADADCSYAHQVWEMDTTPADVMLIDESQPRQANGEWHSKKMSILGVIDRWSRRAKFVVVPFESAQAVRRTVTETIIEWGVTPTTIMTDQGSGYINNTMETALELVGINHRPCPPGSPEKKPHIERLFGTFTRERAELLQGFSGHNVAQAQKLRAVARKKTGRPVITAHITADDLQRVLNAWVDGVYHQREHSTLRMSPMRKWMSSPVPARAPLSEGRLKLCLSELVGIRKIGKKGVEWKKGSYWSAPLAAWIGREVMVRRDEDDLGALFIFSPDGEYIDTAVNWERSGLSQKDFARAAQRHQSDYMTRMTRELNQAAPNFNMDDAKRYVLMSDAEAAGKLVHLNAHAQNQAASDDEFYNAGGPPAVNYDMAPETMMQASETVHDYAPTPHKGPRTPNYDIPSPVDEQRAKIAANIARCDQILAAHANGFAVEADALEWAQIYVDGPSYKSGKVIEATFGAPANQSKNTDDERKVS